MSVQVDELHTDVVPAGIRTGERDTAQGGAPTPPWAAEEQWRAARRRAEWLACRVRAEDFDD